MITKIKFSILLILGLNSFIFCQTGKNSLKDEAKQFSLDFVKLYFQKDCNKNYELMADSLINFNSNNTETLVKAKYKDKLCNSHGKAVRDKSKSFADYLKAYDIQIFSADEVESGISRSLPDGYVATDSDFFFMGGHLKDEYGERFVWDDAFSFMVRKENGKWIVKGL